MSNSYQKSALNLPSPTEQLLAPFPKPKLSVQEQQKLMHQTSLGGRLEELIARYGYATVKRELAKLRPLGRAPSAPGRASYVASIVEMAKIGLRSPKNSDAYELIISLKGIPEPRSPKNRGSVNKINTLPTLKRLHKKGLAEMKTLYPNSKSDAYLDWMEGQWQESKKPFKSWLRDYLSKLYSSE